MYVKIGKYSTHYSPFRFFEWLEKHIGEAKSDKLSDVVAPIFHAWNNRPWNTRKIKVVIHPSDVWSMDSTLAYVILPMLKKLKETKHGSPDVDNEDVPECMRSTSAPPVDKNTGNVDDFHHLRWEYVLDEMIWAFEQINSDWEEQYYSTNTGAKFDRDGYFKHYKRMQNGTRLFGKYYFSLWD